MPATLRWSHTDPNRTWEYSTPTGIHAQSEFFLKRPAVVNRTFYGGTLEPGGPAPGETWDGQTAWATHFADGKIVGGGQRQGKHPIQSPMEFNDDTIPQEPFFERVRRNAQGLTQRQVHRNYDTPRTDDDRYAHPVHTLGTWDTVPRYTVGSVDGAADVMPHSSMFDEILALKQSLADTVSFNAFRPLPMPTTSRQYQRIGNRILSTSRASNGDARLSTM